jgi:hypothetical protein
MSRINLANCFIFFTVVCYCAITVSGEDFAAPIVLWYLMSVFESQFLYGILPIVAILGMLSVIAFRRKLAVFVCCSAAQVLPLIFGLVTNDLTYPSFYIACSLYILFLVSSTITIIKSEGFLMEREDVLEDSFDK